MKALKDAYPDHNWPLDKTPKTKPRAYWSSTENARDYIKSVEAKLSTNTYYVTNYVDIRNLDEWYSVPVEYVHKNGGSGLLKRYRKSK
jgi:hypothetical protein